MKKIDNKKTLSYIRRDPSSWLLILTNLIIIALAIVQRWSIGNLLWSYLSQSIIIGFFNVIKILSLKNFSTAGYKIGDKEAKPTKKIKWLSALFFVFHYGGFHLIYILFLRNFLVLGFDKFLILKMSGLFFANHLFSFLYNLKSDHEMKINIGKLMFLPYFRIVPIHLIIIAISRLLIPALIIFGLSLAVLHMFSNQIYDPSTLPAMPVLENTAKVILIIIFLGLKTLADILTHIFEHTDGFAKIEKTKKTNI